MFVYLVIRITVVLRKVTLLCVGNSLAPLLKNNVGA